MKIALRRYRTALLAFVSFAVILAGCSNPRYRSNVSTGIDQKIEYERGMDLEALIQQRLEKAERGLEVMVSSEDLDAAYRPLQKWIAEIKDAEGTLKDPQDLMSRYPLLQREGAPDELAKLKNKIADRTEGLFNATERNRRLLLAKQFNMTLREEKQNLLFLFLHRGNLGQR